MTGALGAVAGAGIAFGALVAAGVVVWVGDRWRAVREVRAARRGGLGSACGPLGSQVAAQGSSWPSVVPPRPSRPDTLYARASQESIDVVFAEIVGGFTVLPDPPERPTP